MFTIGHRPYKIICSDLQNADTDTLTSQDKKINKNKCSQYLYQGIILPATFLKLQDIFDYLEFKANTIIYYYVSSYTNF